MITFSVQRNIHAGPVIVASRFAGPGYQICDMPLDETTQVTVNTLYDIYVMAMQDFTSKSTIRYFMEAELKKISDPADLEPGLTIPTLDARILHEDHGFYWAYHITGNTTKKDLVSIPISRPHYFGLKPADKEVLPTYIE